MVPGLGSARKRLLVLPLLVAFGVHAAPGANHESMATRAAPFMPVLRTKILKYWPDVPYPVTLAALVEQESLWNPHAELCVPKGTCAREYGFGFGQLTITPRFNVFEETKALNLDLRNWSYQDRFNSDYQLAAVVLKNKMSFKQCTRIMKSGLETQACGFSSYNGGYGAVVADRRLCANTLGCDPFKWFKNVETVSFKAKTAQPGYGKSFFEINREYVHLVMQERAPKYVIFPGFEILPFPH